MWLLWLLWGCGETLALPEEAVRVDGPARSGFGSQVSGAGDIDGDGVGDIVIAGKSEQGRASAWAFFGPIRSDVRAGGSELAYTAHSAQLGVAAAGDIDGDGYGDLIFAEPRPSPSEVGAVLLHGPDGARQVELTSAISRPGTSAVGLGDCDGDGLADLAVTGFADNEVLAWVVRGPISGDSMSLQDADASMTSTQRYFTGGTAEAAGDVDGDGLADMVVTAHAAGPHDQSRSVLQLYVAPFEGAVTSEHVQGALDTDGPSRLAVDGGHDVDGDGLADLVAGDRLDDDGAGIAWVFSGNIWIHYFMADAAIATFTGRVHAVGADVSLAGDLDGDGLSEVLIGSDEAGDHREPAPGIAYLLYGPVDGAVDLDRATRLVGGDHDGVGTALDGVGDVDDDRVPDLLFGAPGSSRAWLVRGSALRDP